MRLIDKYPGKVRFMMYNTGGMGEIIETIQENDVLKKKLVRKTDRVPLKLMAAIQRGDLRGTNIYEKCNLGTKAITGVEGRQIPEYELSRFYSKDQVDFYIKDLVEGRRKYTDIINSEGLSPEVRRAAEKAFRVETNKQQKTVIRAGLDIQQSEPVVIVKSNEPISRPRRPGSWRWR